MTQESTNASRAERQDLAQIEQYLRKGYQLRVCIRGEGSDADFQASILNVRLTRGHHVAKSTFSESLIALEAFLNSLKLRP